MKKLLVPLLTLAFLLMASTAMAGDEKKAVATAIDNELAAYLSGDYDAWSAYWVHEPYVIQMFARDTYVDITKSWESLSEKVKKEIEKGDNAGTNIEKGEYDIQIFGETALVNSKEKLKVDLFGEERVYKQVCTYMLVKQEGSWKFVSMNTINKTSFKVNDFNIEMRLNMTGYQLLGEEKVDEAIEVFVLNTELFPGSYNTWDSLGEAWMIKGDTEKATKYYNKSLELNPKNTNATNMIEKMKTKE